MNRFIILIGLFIAGMILICGCTDSSSGFYNQGPKDQTVMGLDTGEETSPLSDLNVFPDYPSPPQDNAVFAQINDKDQTDKSITVFFSGGEGQKMVKSAWVLFKPENGRIERVPLDVRKQSEVVLKGTSGEDQVRVYAEYFDGNTYLIGERSVRMRMRI